MATIRWTLEKIKLGIDSYIDEFGKPPTARDFDIYPGLPSARQIQRMFGGMAALRQQLGYKDLDFTKGELRRSIATEASSRGVAAEEYLEPILIAHFGEPYVHTQKRYAKGTKNRYDFFIYAENTALGVDVFTTTKLEYIGVNVRHKIHKYKQLSDIETYFVLIGDNFDKEAIQKARQSTPLLNQHKNLHLIGETDFLDFIQTLTPLPIPKYFKKLEIEHF